ncbi:MAG: hypothetical protein ACMXX9_02875 [Candidatus Woesearchaeota archaeon]
MKLEDDKLGDLEQIANYIAKDNKDFTRQLFLVDNIDGLSSEANKDALYAGIAANIAKQIDDHNNLLDNKVYSLDSEYIKILSNILKNVSDKTEYLK